MKKCVLYHLLLGKIIGNFYSIAYFLILFTTLASCRSDFNPDKHTRSLSKEDSLFIKTYLEPEKTARSISTIGSSTQKTQIDQSNKQLDKSKIIPPTYPIKGEKHFLTGKQDSLTINIEVERSTTYSVNFKMEIKQADTWLTQEGSASIYPQFNINAPVDAQTIGSAAFSTFHQSQNLLSSRDTCFTHLILGKEKGNSDKIRGKLIKNCNGMIRDIELDNFPTLLEMNPQ